MKSSLKKEKIMSKQTDGGERPTQEKKTRGQIAVGKIERNLIDVWRNGDKYYLLSREQNQYIPYTEKQIRKKLIREGVASGQLDSEMFSPLDDAMDYILEHRHVNTIIPCCPAVKAGYNEKGKYLVLAEPNKPELIEGDYSIIDEFFTSAFGENKHYFYGYMKNVLTGLVDFKRCKGHHLVVAGNAGKGKSYMGAVMSYITGYNGALCESSIEFVKGVKDHCREAFFNPWLVNDDAGIGNFTRAHYIERLKNINYAGSFTMRAMYGDTVSLPSNHKTVQFVNLSEQALKSVPCLDESFKNKLILLRINDDAVIPFSEFGSDDELRNEKMSDQYKAMAYYLYHEYEIPEEYKAPASDPRGLVKSFVDPSVIELVHEGMPDSKLLEILISEIDSGWYQSSELHNELATNSAYKGLNLTPVTLGRMLARISENPDIIKTAGISLAKQKHHNKAGYKWVKSSEKSGDANVTNFESLIKELELDESA